MGYHITTARELADAIGRQKIADTMGVGLTAVSNAVVRGQFPASWFTACQELARPLAVEVSPDLFGMKPGPQNVNSPRPFRGNSEKPDSGRAA